MRWEVPVCLGHPPLSRGLPALHQPNLQDISVRSRGPALQPMLLHQQLCQAQLESSPNPPYGLSILWPLTTALQVTHHWGKEQEVSVCSVGWEQSLSSPPKSPLTSHGLHISWTGLVGPGQQRGPLWRVLMEGVGWPDWSRWEHLWDKEN